VPEISVPPVYKAAGFTELVKKLALNPTIPTAGVQIAYAVVSEVERKIAKHCIKKDDVKQAFLSQREAANEAGIGTTSFSRNIEHVEDLSVTTGDDWNTRSDRDGKPIRGGFASIWSFVSEPVPATFTGDRLELDSKLVGAWLHPKNLHWNRRKGLGHEAWRLILILLATYGATDIEISASEVAAMLGCSPSYAAVILTKMAADEQMSGFIIIRNGVKTKILLGQMLATCSKIWDKIEGNQDRTEHLFEKRNHWLDRAEAYREKWASSDEPEERKPRTERTNWVLRPKHLQTLYKGNGWHASQAAGFMPART
jgi:hypothetical protein